MGPQVAALAKSRKDTVLRKIDIVNWSSPVAKQYKIRSIPHIELYDQKGRRVARGWKKAYSYLRKK